MEGIRLQIQSQSQTPAAAGLDHSREGREGRAEIASGPSAWRDAYRASPGAFDEMVTPENVLRPQWAPFVSQVDLMGPAELSQRWEQGRRLIHDNGVTYNVYGDPRGMDRPWELDAIPMLLSEADWRTLEPALIQRAHVLNLLLADLYGPQKTLSDGVFPAELVLRHPGFLRPCKDMKPPHDAHMNLYAADLARMPGGGWAVLADRTQAPSGAGYALENRIVLARVFSDLFKRCGIQRLALFFRKVRESLAALAPYNRDNPRIVLLTPGPFNETYFEHAYLARYLNYTLVEGGDLTVRDQCVFLKTLGGLHRVDVILRRLDADFCDPLELRPDSALGVPGLVQAVRAGNVAVANPLGSGVAETPALNSFMPALCRYLLNEDLKLPSFPSYWCGRPEALQHTLTNLERMVVKAAFATPGLEPVFGAKLSRDELELLSAQIRAQPQLYVAQDQAHLSTVPVLVNDRIHPRQAVLRTYLVAHDRDFSAMPGGLTQVPPSADTLVFSLQRGGGSKDTWVGASGPVSEFSLLRPAHQPLELTRAGGDLPSRVADNLFWLGRYVERAEGSVRLLRGIINRLSERSATGDEHSELRDLLEALRQQRPGVSGRISPATPAPPGAAGVPAESEVRVDERSVDEQIQQVLELERGTGGLRDTLRQVRGVARMVRDRLSNDTWRVIRNLDVKILWPEKEDSVTRLNALLAKLDQLVIVLASFGGLASESMTRGQVWRFLDLGRRLERTLNVSKLLRSTLTQPRGEETALLESVLEICDSLMTYRRRYLASLQTAPVLDLLLADESNPRAIAFQLAALDEHVASLPRDATRSHLLPEQRITLSNLSNFRLADIEALCTAGPDGRRGALKQLLEKLETDLSTLSDLIVRQYLSHAQTSRHLVSLDLGDRM